MALTVREALQIGSLVEARVLAGAAGLDNVIRAVDIIDVPDAAIWFRRDSLLSTTFYALKDNIGAQLQMLEDIKSCGGAALIIFSPERYISQIDNRLVKKADALNLPLLQMPDCSYIDVIVPVMSRILDKQVQALEYAREVHAMMTDIMLKGKGLQELLSSLTVLLQKPVLMADAELVLREAAVPPGLETASPLIRQWQGEREPCELTGFYHPGLLNELLAERKPAYYQNGSAEADFLDFFFPVVAGSSFFGVLIVPDLEGELERSKTVAVEAGAMAIALDILKAQAIREAERKSELDFYNELLLGNIKQRENIVSQARRFGLDVTGSYFVILVELNRESIFYGSASPHPPAGKTYAPPPGREELEKRLFRLLHYTLESAGAEGTVIETLGSLVMLVRVPDGLDQDAARLYGGELAHRIRKILAERLEDIPVCIAAGDYCADIERISAGYLEAWETIDIGKKLFGADFTLTYSAATPYHLVRRFLTSAGASGLYENVFAPLIRHDREKGGELVKTLEALLKCNFSRTRTAEKLHLHRNSLNYRLQKIEELLGRDIGQLDPFPLLLASISRRLYS